MILEGVVTTTAIDGGVHLAPMGPLVSDDRRTLLLRPFPTSNTYRNLLRHPEGVFHLTDDVLLIAKAALGQAGPPRTRSATAVRGFILEDACRYFAFAVTHVDDSEQRVKLHAEVRETEILREFVGFNRAKHAVLEAAVFATRFHLLPAAEIEAEFAKLRVIVAKTGGPAEREGMDFLDAAFARHRAGGES